MKKLAEEEKEAVRGWLKSKNTSDCPFFPGNEGIPCNDKYNYPICASWFVKIKESFQCPCNLYSLSYVIRRAREMVKS